MTDINIPPEVEEAAARAVLRAVSYDIEPDVRANGMTNDEYRTIAEAALIAGLKAWPGMTYERLRFTGDIGLILPLPQEINE